ncbi:hypothetical protein N183_14540 [Sinorhizobium sp. Sb3]|nr:hypothetical protein N183_14540 [Sinorhizobium sp. Sb3]
MKGIFELAGRQTPVLIFELETACEVSAGAYRRGEWLLFPVVFRI